MAQEYEPYTVKYKYIYYIPPYNCLHKRNSKLLIVIIFGRYESLYDDVISLYSKKRRGSWLRGGERHTYLYRHNTRIRDDINRNKEILSLFVRQK